MSDFIKYQRILDDIKKKIFYPIYFLEGEEPFYFDQIIQGLLEYSLKSNEHTLNLFISYGKEQPLSKIISYARTFPMLGERKLVIMKNAQEVDELQNKTGQKKLLEYLENPHPTNIIAVAYKNKKLPRNNILAKSISEKGLLFTTSRIYENQVATWVEDYIKTLGYQISRPAAILLEALIGNNLQLLASELKKVILNHPLGSKLKESHIATHVSMQKEFNNFALQNALSERNSKKTLEVLQHFVQSKNQSSLLLLISLLTTFFTKVLQVYKIQNHDKKSIATSLKIHPYFIKNYITASYSYKITHTIHILHALQKADNQVKGINAPHLSEESILEELIAQILNPHPSML